MPRLHAILSMPQNTALPALSALSRSHPSAVAPAQVPTPPSPPPHPLIPSPPCSAPSALALQSSPQLAGPPAFGLWSLAAARETAALHHELGVPQGRLQRPGSCQTCCQRPGAGATAGAARGRTVPLREQPLGHPTQGSGSRSGCRKHYEQRGRKRKGALAAAVLLRFIRFKNCISLV